LIWSRIKANVIRLLFIIGLLSFKKRYIAQRE